MDVPDVPLINPPPAPTSSSQHLFNMKSNTNKMQEDFCVMNKENARNHVHC